MIPTFVTAGTPATAGAANITPGLPAGVQEGDVLILFLGSAQGAGGGLNGFPVDDSTPPHYTPAGWTRLHTFRSQTNPTAQPGWWVDDETYPPDVVDPVTYPHGYWIYKTYVPPAPSDDIRGRIAVYWRRATASEVAPTLVSTLGDVPAKNWTAVIHAYRNCRAGDPFDPAAQAQPPDGLTTAVVFPAVDVTSGDCLVINHLVYAIDSATPQFTFTANSDLANMVERTDYSTTQDFGLGQAIVTGEKAIAGNVQATAGTLLVVPASWDSGTFVLMGARSAIAVSEVYALHTLEYVAFEMTRRYWGISSFTLTAQRRQSAAVLLTPGQLLYVNDPDGNGRAFVVEQYEFAATSGAQGDITISGRSVDGVATEGRFAIPPVGTTYDAQELVPAETAILHYIDANSGPSADDVRQIANFTVATDLGRGEDVSVWARYTFVYELVVDLARSSGLGWEVTFDPATGDHEFAVIEGTDRTATVLFDFEFDSVSEWAEVTSLIEVRNVAIMAGAGAGVGREVIVRWSGMEGAGDIEPAGLSRREAFISEGDPELTAWRLRQAAREFLAASAIETAVEVQVNQTSPFQYGVDWFLGDVVTLRDRVRSILRTARIVEVNVAHTSSFAAPEITAVMDRPFPTLRDQVKRDTVYIINAEVQ